MEKINKFFVVGVLICLMIFSGGNGYGKESPQFMEEIKKMPPEIAKASSVSQVQPFLQSPDIKMRIGAAKRLGEIGDERAVSLLTERFRNEGREETFTCETISYVKLEIIDALGKIGGKRAKSALFEIFSTYLKQGTRARPPLYFYDDGDYASVIRATSEALYNLYDPKEDTEIYDLFKTIALQEKKDWDIMENGSLRIIAYAIYLKGEIYIKGLTREEAIKYVDEIYDNPPPWASKYVNGVLAQGYVIMRAASKLCKEYKFEIYEFEKGK